MTNPSSRTSTRAFRFHGVAGGLAALLIVPFCLSSSFSLFVWPDLAIVHVAATWVAAALTAAWLTRTAPWWLALGCAAILLATGVALAAMPPASFFAGLLVRTLVAFAIVLTAQVIAARIVPARDEARRTDRSLALFAIVFALLAPGLYGAQRTIDQLARLSERLEQHRYGTAAEIARKILRIRPEAQWLGQSLADVDRQLGSELATIHEQLEEAATDNSPRGPRDRALLLAIASRSSEAEAIARSLLDSPEYAVEAALLLGTLEEERGAWESSRAWYARALGSLVIDREHASDALRAINGIAYAQRKQGHRAAAEEFYLKGLQFAPTAEQHFLLAQFYEDIQRGDRAAIHAHAAIHLDPGRFERAGNVLLDKLQQHHPACFEVYRSRQ